MDSTKNSKKKFCFRLAVAAAVAFGFAGVPAVAYAEVDPDVWEDENAEVDGASGGNGAAGASDYSRFSVSLEAVYAAATKKDTRGGIDMAGIDLRMNFDPDESNQLSVGIVMLGGSEYIGGGADLDATNVALLVGYRYRVSLTDRLSAFIGVRAGVVYADYERDYGHYSGWDVYLSDDDTCAACAGEIGLSFLLSEHWSVRGGYEFYGNTMSLGGGAAKYEEQQYHLFQLGAEYRF